MSRIVEIWKNIIYNNIDTGYLISDGGRVKNNKTGRILKPSIDGSGYQQVNLHFNGMNKQFKVHILVAQAFIPNPENKPTVNHKLTGMENKKNNDVDNLEWATHSEQIKHAYDNGAHTRECPTRKVTDEQVKDIVRYIYKGKTNKEISKLVNIPHYTVSAIRRNKTNLYQFDKVINLQKTYSNKIIHSICKLMAKGYRNIDIYNEVIEKYNIDMSLIEHLRAGDIHKDILKQYNLYYKD